VTRLDALKAATEDFLAASLVGDGLEDALSRMGAAESESAVVLSLDNGSGVRASIQTPEVAEAAAAVFAGLAPPDDRSLRCNPLMRAGFRTDQDDFSEEEMARSPWYQEFLRPRGYFWNATAALMDGPGGEKVCFSFKRKIRSGPFERGEVALFDAVLPDLRHAASLIRRMYEFETLGMVKLIHERGDPVFELDVWGRVARVHAFDDRRPVRSLKVIQRRLVAEDRLAQIGLDRAIGRALARPGATAAARLPTGDGGWSYLLCVPVVGRARDIFLATAAVAVLIGRSRRPGPLALAPAGLRDAFSLTDREARVAALLGDGLSLGEIARNLRMGPGTARNHLKAVFEKTGTKRQAELVALLGVLRP
jgi:DNA-binding CsgD family transcriptional regulator